MGFAQPQAREAIEPVERAGGDVRHKDQIFRFRSLLETVITPIARGLYGRPSSPLWPQRGGYAPGFRPSDPLREAHMGLVYSGSGAADGSPAALPPVIAP
jgi:hypothetical protein